MTAKHGGSDAVAPSRLPSTVDQRARLARLPLFHGMDAELLDAIAAELTWFALPGGATLFSQGDDAEAMYVVVYGRLSVIVEDENGISHTVAQIGPGEIAGEMGFISDEPRSATLVALRDCELLELERQAFEHLVRQYPDALLHIARQLAKRLRQSTNARPDTGQSPTTIMVTAGAPGAPSRELAARLAQALESLNEKTAVLDRQALNQETGWFHRLEGSHRHVLYVAEHGDEQRWVQRCLRQSDCILVVAQAGSEPPPGSDAVPLATASPTRPLELVLVNPDDAEQPEGARAWMQHLPFEFHCHVRMGNAADMQRLARLVLRRAVGLALSGGGARGFAHAGVIRAVREAGVPIDLIGGTSIGSIMGGAAALGWDDERIAEMVRRHFDSDRAFHEYTLPIVSLFRGRRMTTMLRDLFGESRLEDTWLPFLCVSTNLTTGTLSVHREGLLWRAIRASVSLPGLLPPVIEAGQVLVDGGMINNFPSNIMSQLNRGRVIGVDVGKVRGLTAMVEDIEPRSLWWLLRNGRRSLPGIVNLLMSSVMVSSTAQAAECRSHADLLLEPPLETISILDWAAHDAAMDLGYRHARDALAQSDVRVLFGLG